MTENEKINGWTFEETIKAVENVMEVENNMFKWDVLRHLRDFTESFKYELEQYRAMEERLNGITVEKVVNGFINTVEDRTEEPYECGRILTNEEADMWNKYRAIGTVEEFKALKKKSVAKKAEWKFDDFTAKFGYPYRCSNCDEEFGDTYNYCPNCGCDMYAD